MRGAPRTGLPDPPRAAAAGGDPAPRGRPGRRRGAGGRATRHLGAPGSGRHLRGPAFRPAPGRGRRGAGPGGPRLDLAPAAQQAAQDGRHVRAAHPSGPARRGRVRDRAGDPGPSADGAAGEAPRARSRRRALAPGRRVPGRGHRRHRDPQPVDPAGRRPARERLPGSDRRFPRAERSAPAGDQHPRGRRVPRHRGRRPAGRRARHLRDAAGRRPHDHGAGRAPLPAEYVGHRALEPRHPLLPPRRTDRTQQRPRLRGPQPQRTRSR